MVDLTWPAVALVGVLALPSPLAAQTSRQFDLNCNLTLVSQVTGGPGNVGRTRVLSTLDWSPTFVIDLEARRLCVRSEAATCDVVSLQPEPAEHLLDLTTSDDGSSIIVNRNTGEITYRLEQPLTTDEPGVHERLGTGRCRPAPFSGLPSALF